MLLRHFVCFLYFGSEERVRAVVLHGLPAFACRYADSALGNTLPKYCGFDDTNVERWQNERRIITTCGDKSSKQKA